MLKRELGIFIVVGLLTVAIDFFTYRGLIQLGLDHVGLAKGLGFIAGWFASRNN